MFDLSRDLPTLDDGDENAHVTDGLSKELSFKRKRCDNDEASTANRPQSTLAQAVKYATPSLE